MKKKFLFLLFFVFPFSAVNAQQTVDCKSVFLQLDSVQHRLEILDCHDPELITLHYLFCKDIQKKLQSIATNIIPNLITCREVDYYRFIDYYENLMYRADKIKDSLEQQKTQVDFLFYAKAKEMYMTDNLQETYYYLDRCLQFNKYYADALIMKTSLTFQDNDYETCIYLIHRLYNEVQLSVEQEHSVSDLTQKLYDKLYQTGDSLVKIDKAADALHIFTILETFCKDMPSNYCNDDYYHGILRSKQGVYESYITIAKIAKERGNEAVYARFMQYAEDYLQQNRELQQQKNER